MKTLKGMTAAPGIAVGTACLYAEKAEENIPHYMISAGGADDEIFRLQQAYIMVQQELKEIAESSEEFMGAPGASDVVRAHEMILADKTLLGRIEGLIAERLINAEHAVSDAFGEYIKKFEEKDRHFAELAHDVIDIRNRVLSAFGTDKGGFECPVGGRQPVVVVAKRLTPSMVINIRREHVLAFVTEEGGFTTHGTILARGYGVPIVFGVNVGDNIDCGSRLIVDGSLGKVVVEPDGETSKYYLDKAEKLKKRRAVCEVRKKEPPRTRTGRRIKLKVNITTPGEMELVKGLNYDGVGLLRTEFLFMNKSAPPEEDEQFDMYRHIVEKAGSLPVVIRLLDIGGDKMPGYLKLPPQENPDLGIRGARALPFFRDVYLTQMKAVLRSSIYGDVRVLYPMVSDAGDLDLFRQAMMEARKELKHDKKKSRARVREGVMIETPSAAVMAGALLEKSDFANIGSNDLLQYTLAAARGNAFVEKRYHVMHPAMVRLMEMVVKAGKRAKKEICLCGEIASFEEFYPVLLGIGLESFSVSVAKFPDIKCHLMHETRPKKSLLRDFYTKSTKEEADRFLAEKSF